MSFNVLSAALAPGWTTSHFTVRLISSTVYPKKHDHNGNSTLCMHVSKAGLQIELTWTFRNKTTIQFSENFRQPHAQKTFSWRRGHLCVALSSRPVFRVRFGLSCSKALTSFCFDLCCLVSIICGLYFSIFIETALCLLHYPLHFLHCQWRRPLLLRVARILNALYSSVFWRSLPPNSSLHSLSCLRRTWGSFRIGSSGAECLRHGR